MSHPPWLRFQAYAVGLPKTGSTSLATVFGSYRTGHEAGLTDLLRGGLPWRAGEIDEVTFWERTTPRLTTPALEMDSATCHHLYAELLAKRFPNAVFVQCVRDAGGWVSSLLDMILTHRMAMRRISVPAELVDLDYVSAMTGWDARAPWQPADQDAHLVPGALRYWAEHMQRMGRVLPQSRTVTVRTSEISRRLSDLARLCGVPVESLRHDLAHANRSAHSLNRLVLYRDHPAVRQAYDRYCAAIMADVFPEEHRAAFQSTAAPGAWQAHCTAVDEQVQRGIEDFRQQRGTAPTTWFRRRS